MVVMVRQAQPIQSQQNSSSISSHKKTTKATQFPMRIQLKETILSEKEANALEKGINFKQRC